jgi:hypothetical protein
MNVSRSGNLHSTVLMGLNAPPERISDDVRVRLWN